MNRVIRLIDNKCDRYLVDADCYTLGRQWDNGSEHIVVEKPAVEVEKSSTCEMFVKANGKLVDAIQVYDEPIAITDLLTQYQKITIGFSFYNADGYIKNSEPKDFYFLEAIKPEAFTPTEPTGKDRLNYLLANGLTDLRWKEGTNNTLELINADSQVVRELELGDFVQEQADLAESNPQSEKYVENKSTKYLQNEGSDGSSPYTTQFEVRKLLSNIADEIGVPTKTSQLENDGDGTSPFVTLLNTYTKEEVNALISAINSMKKEIVDTLPTENIDENTIYLVPKTNGSGNDYFNEYLYINGKFEFIGSTQVEWTDYVKKTDYASTSKAGIVKSAGAAYGIQINETNGNISLSTASDTELQNKATNHAVKVNQIDKAVKIGLTTNTETLTDDEKQSATDLIGAVKQVQYSQDSTLPSGSDAGYYGRAYVRDKINQENSIPICSQNRNYTIPIRDHNGNFYVGDPTIDFHCVHKKYADAIKQTAEAKVDKITTQGTLRVYGIGGDGDQRTFEVITSSNNATVGRMPRYQDSSLSTTMGEDKAVLATGTPKEGHHCANKKYVDGLVPKIELTLKENGAYTLTINKG